MLGTGLLYLLLLLAATEIVLGLRGFRATVLDTEQRWIAQRSEASRLGSQALILVGASRIQLGIDLDVLREVTGLQPVQLAIDGSSFVPVLEGLADDPTVTGTVLISYQDGTIPGGDRTALPARYEAHYRSRTRAPSDYRWVEDRLSETMRTHFRNYADGARPLDSLLQRVVVASATPQYLMTLPDRSRMADYQRVSMPGFYYGRVMRDLGDQFSIPSQWTYGDLDRELQRRIAAVRPADNGQFLKVLPRLEAAINALQERGARVLFVMMPTSGLVNALHERRFPRNEFWEQFARKTRATTLHFADVPALAAFQCPDGSHLDYRDRGRFTQHLATALGLARRVPGRVAALGS